MHFKILAFIVAALAAAAQAEHSAQNIVSSLSKVSGLVRAATKTADSIGGNSYRGAVPRLVINTRNIIGLLTGEVQNSLAGLGSIGGDNDDEDICEAFNKFTKTQTKFLGTIASKGDVLTGGPAELVIANILHALKGGVDGVAAGVIDGAPTCQTAAANKKALDEALDEALESIS
ncbi:hypothetical protein AK830_g4559 [Neonectria ditissima]|uniref:Cell wall galactomannoprotein n=1 Tax=Neonectria ditissima TaxID=78410 RepID=A0A0P7B665_9HYPO|nr:hypothetical protein AK830_g4559 [Neonectria ditissima]